MITSSTSGRFCSNFCSNQPNPGFPGFFLELIPYGILLVPVQPPVNPHAPAHSPRLSQNPLVQSIFSLLCRLSIPHKARIGLVGANGIGKTTLLRILAGVDDSSGGAVHQARNVRIGLPAPGGSAGFQPDPVGGGAFRFPTPVGYAKRSAYTMKNACRMKVKASLYWRNTATCNLSSTMPADIPSKPKCA